MRRKNKTPIIRSIGNVDYGSNKFGSLREKPGSEVIIPINQGSFGGVKGDGSSFMALPAIECGISKIPYERLLRMFLVIITIIVS